MVLDWVSVVVGAVGGFLLGWMLASLWKSRRAAKETYGASIVLMRTVTSMLERYDRRRADVDKPPKVRITEEERS